jgi:hypothetical protein
MNLCLLASWVKRYHSDTEKLWKKIVDHKYRNDSPNLFACPELGASPFWKGVLWAARAAKMGYRWKVGNGRSVKFWEDHWFGSCSLAIQFWDLYVFANEKSISVANAWDGLHLKLTFRRSVDQQLMNRWYDLVSVAELSSLLEMMMLLFGNMRVMVFILLAHFMQLLILEESHLYIFLLFGRFKYPPGCMCFCGCGLIIKFLQEIIWSKDNT